MLKIMATRARDKKSWNKSDIVQYNIIYYNRGQDPTVVTYREKCTIKGIEMYKVKVKNTFLECHKN